MSRVLLIGLDGATLDLVEPWARAGKLPIMASLMQRGGFGRLRSVLPVLSSAAWVSMMTGLNPGKHGIFDFVRRETGSYRLRVLRRDHMRGASLWRLLSMQGRKVGVLNVPMTYPPEPVNGFLVSGLGTPNYKPFTYPPSLERELLTRGYRVNKRVAFRPGNEDAFLRETYEMTDMLADAAWWLMTSQEWDLFTIVFRDTDELTHFFWRYMDPTHPAHNPATDLPHQDAVLYYYQKIDTLIGALVEAAGADTTTIILSDHGAGPLYQHVFLNEWLRQMGFLQTVETPSPGGRLRKAVSRVGLTRENVSNALGRLRLGRVEQWLKDELGARIELLPRTRRMEFPACIDWSHTYAYSFGYHGQIYINLRGREPAGIVEPGTGYTQMCEHVAAALKTFVDPRDGRPVVDQVIHRDEAFHGPCIEYAPDLIVLMRDLAYITRQGYEFGDAPGQIFADPVDYESGSHRMDGMLILAGAGVSNHGYKEGAQLIDITPTVLHLLRCPIPDEMDGRVLDDWLTLPRQVIVSSEEYCDAYTPPPANTNWAGHDSKSEQEILERLRNLGYLE